MPQKCARKEIKCVGESATKSLHIMLRSLSHIDDTFGTALIRQMLNNGSLASDKPQTSQIRF